MTNINVNLIQELDLLTHIQNCTDDMTVEKFGGICNFQEQAYSLVLECVKTTKWNTEFCSDRDIITYLVNREILPEGNYLIITE